MVERLPTSGGVTVPEQAAHPESTPATRVLRAARQAPLLTHDEERRLSQRVHGGDRDATEMLLISHLRLVISIAQGYARHGIPLEDLIGEGCVGLVEAARRFEPERGTRFAVYAAWWIRAHVRRYTVANRRIVRAPSTRVARRLLAQLRKTQRSLAQTSGGPVSSDVVSRVLGVTTEEVQDMEAVLTGRDVPLAAGGEEGYEVSDSSPSPEERAAEAESRRLRETDVRRALVQLDEREREIVHRRYLEPDKTSLATIAKSMGLSRERVRQLEQRARSKMRGAIPRHVA